jgi:Transposase IS66 family
VLMQYHQGQTTLPRLAALLQSVGLSISEREIQRLLTEKQDGFLDENRDVLRTGLQTSSWISVDDTGARHKAKNGYCTQIGNEHFSWFGTRATTNDLLPRIPSFLLPRWPGSDWNGGRHQIGSLAAVKL